MTTVAPTSRATLDHPHDPDALRFWGGVVCLALAPVLLLLGSALHPVEADSGAAQMEIVAAHSARWEAVHVVLVVGAVVMVAAVLVLAGLVTHTFPRLGRIGAAFGVVGSCALVAVFALEGLGAHALLALDTATAGSALDLIWDEALMGVAPLTLSLMVGLVLLAVGLQRSASCPPWVAGALGVGAVALIVGQVAEVDLAAFAGMSLMTVAMVVIAAQRARSAR